MNRESHPQTGADAHSTIRRCPACQRVNPAEAVFCFFDGKPIGNAAGSDAGSIDFTTWAFPRPFVFPGGEECRNFLQLGLACVRHPAETINALRDGSLGTFFGGLGRIDLAMASKTLAAMLDGDRALDELLGKLPGSLLRPAELTVEPSAKNLGQVQMGEDREFVLELTNKGNRLVYGKASVVDCPWLVLGEAGAPEKLFQFFENTSLSVRVPGKRLVAFSKPKQAEITIESNGGNVTVVVEILVPVKPFPEGILAGVTSPRQLATKAKAHLKEAATLLENGTVARWYETNGWTYPVQGPTAKGIAAVQQFFEYLGLVKPPKVEISESAVTLRGGPGQRLEHKLMVTASDNRAAFAHAISDEAWLRVGKTVFSRQTAAIPLLVSSVPGEPGQTLRAHVKVIANGNQRFDVDVTLHVTDASVPVPSSEAETVSFLSRFESSSSPAVSDDVDLSVFADLTAATPNEQRPRRAVAAPTTPFADLSAFSSKPSISLPSSSPSALRQSASGTPLPAVPTPEATTVEARRVPSRPASQWRRTVGVLLARLLPVLIIVIGLLAALLRDILMHKLPGSAPV